VTDNRFSYHLYAPQQDYGAIGMSSQSGSSDFYSVHSWERAHIAFDPDNPRLIYSTSNNLSLTEFDRETGRTRLLKVYPQYTLGVEVLLFIII